MRRVLSIVVAGVVLGVGHAAYAAGPQGTAAGADAGTQAGGAGGQVTAEDLFQQGIELIGKGKWAEAAVKLEESNRLDRAAGTTVNLADCYEHMGKAASAWTLFMEAAAVFGRRTPPDPRGETAKTRAEALFPKLSRLTLEVPEGVRGTAGLVVKRDGEVVGAGQFGTGIAVDPGVHVLEASAPGKKPWKSEAKVGGDAAKVTVSVPVLEDAPAGVGGGSDKDVGGGEAGWPWQKKVAVGAASVGVAGVVVGAILGADALGKHGELAKECSAGDPRMCTAKGLSIIEGERTSATVSTIGFAAGGALIAAGVVLWIVAPSGGEPGAPEAKGKAAAKVWVAPQIGGRTGISAGVVW